jgi:hypothetical protein
MVIKIDRGDGTFHLFPEVKDAIFSGPNQFAKCLQQETLPEYFDKMFSPPVPKPEPVAMSYYDVDPESYPTEQKKLFFGVRREVEMFCMKKLFFIQDKIEYCVVTEYPVYLCSDSGKTLEVLK